MSSATFSHAQSASNKQAASEVIDVVPLSKEAYARQLAAKDPTSPWYIKTQNKSWAIECIDNFETVESEASKKKSECRLNYTGIKDEYNVKQSEIDLNSTLYGITVTLIAVGKKKKLTPVAIIKTPLNIILPKGLSLSVDKSKLQKYAIRSCHVDIDKDKGSLVTACLVPLRVSAALLNKFKRGDFLNLSTKALDGSLINARFSLQGFNKLYNDLIGN